jgi:hypothetical protein
MHGGDSLNAPALVTAVVNADINVSPPRFGVHGVRPSRPPFPRFGLVVPIHGVDFAALERAASQADFLAILVEGIPFPRFRSPKSAPRNRKNLFFSCMSL